MKCKWPKLIALEVGKQGGARFGGVFQSLLAAVLLGQCCVAYAQMPNAFPRRSQPTKKEYVYSASTSKETNLKKIGPLASKYLLNIPIVSIQSSEWYERILVENLLGEYLESELAKLGFTHFKSVSFDGKSVYVEGAENYGFLSNRRGEMFNGICGQLLQGILGQEIVIRTSINLDTEIGILFKKEDNGNKNGNPRINNGHYFSYRQGGGGQYSLKDNFLDEKGINANSLWTAILNAIGQSKGFEVDPSTESTDISKREGFVSYTNRVRTIPHIDVKNGFVNKYFVEVEMGVMKMKSGDVMSIKNLLHIMRKRASASNSSWVTIKIGDYIKGTSVSGFEAKTTSIPVWDSIMRAVRK